jgi:hypothetical protein
MATGRATTRRYLCYNRRPTLLQPVAPVCYHRWLDLLQLVEMVADCATTGGLVCYKSWPALLPLAAASATVCRHVRRLCYHPPLSLLLPAVDSATIGCKLAISATYGRRLCSHRPPSLLSPAAVSTTTVGAATDFPPHFLTDADLRRRCYGQ